MKHQRRGGLGAEAPECWVNLEDSEMTTNRDGRDDEE